MSTLMDSWYATQRLMALIDNLGKNRLAAQHQLFIKILINTFYYIG